MTEKRFTKVEHIFELNDEGIKDNQTRIEYYYALDLIDLLNELSEENEQLKQSFDKSLLNHTKTCDEYRILSKKNKRLKEENKQLKEKNATIKGRIINAIVKSNQVECNCSPCICEDYVNEELKKW